MQNALFSSFLLAVIISTPIPADEMHVMLGDNTGRAATVVVNSGAAGCIGDCEGLDILFTSGASNPSHGHLSVSGSFGPFQLNVYSQGGAFVASPGLVNLSGEETVGPVLASEFARLGDPFFLDGGGVTRTHEEISFSGPIDIAPPERSIVFAPVAVPEPASVVLFGTALLGAAGLTVRRRFCKR